MYPIVKVKWINSATEHGWRDKQNGIGDVNLECESVGYLGFEDAKEIVLMQSINDYQVSELIHIPKVSIISKEELCLKELK